MHLHCLIPTQEISPKIMQDAMIECDTLDDLVMQLVANNGLTILNKLVIEEVTTFISSSYIVVDSS